MEGLFKFFGPSPPQFSPSTRPPPLLMLRLEPLLLLRHRHQPLHKRRVRVVVRRVRPVALHSAQILDMNLRQAALQALHAEVDAVPVGRKLGRAGVYGQEERYYLVGGGPEVEHEYHQRYERRHELPVEPERLVKVRRVHHHAEPKERSAEVQLRDEEVHEGVGEGPVAELVAEDGEELVLGHLGHEGVEEDNTLVLAEAEHEGVAANERRC